MTGLTPQWVKSSYSGNGSCVEWAPGVAATTGVVPVRDSKQSGGPVLTVRADGWVGFMSAVRAGQLSSN